LGAIFADLLSPLSLLRVWREGRMLMFVVRQPSGWIHQELQHSQDGQPDIFRVLR
jgi:hypothetical protein